MRSGILRLRASILQLPPEQAALLLSVGLVLGVFPIMVIPTFLCLAAAVSLRLNAPALQVLNSATSPLQLALLVPLERVGAWMCRAYPFGGTSLIGKIGMAAAHAVLGWLCVCVPAGVLLYFALVRATVLANALASSSAVSRISGISYTARFRTAAARSRYRA